MAIPAVGTFLAVGGATSALADEPASFAASAVPFTAAVSATALLDTEAPDTSVISPNYEKIASGRASYYGRELAGNRTASGERFNPSDLTAAHRTLPLGSKVRVTNPKTGNSVIVRINDRGPFHSNRLIDLSEAAARQIGIRAAGSGIVDLAVQAD
jgi:rare lipoprotein A